MDEDYAKTIEKATAKALDLEFKPSNGPVKGTKEPTLTDECDILIASLQKRIEWLRAIRSTL
jgi:hypothetical protein